MRLRLFLPLFALVFASFGRAAAPPVHFGRDILPILSRNCFLCHGPDDKARKGKLRLDTREGALRVVVPGHSAASELARRISANDPRELMPPPKTHRRLNQAEKDLLRRWIDQGVAWGKHWAYETPQQPALPPIKRSGWPCNGIDYFVLSRLEAEGLAPAPEASRETLIRRVTFDLTGVPPSLREVDDFLADQAADAYEKLVDRLLASERYGERMAMDWLDVARFADTNGYQNDFARSMWPWRDWVIRAFNANMPFDQFVIEQLAGDLLPHATLQQKIATGFNRNNRSVTEAGSIDEEWRIENAVDRLETTATVFLGLTLGCARCHEHKYDTISQKEFYQFLAYFTSINERGVYTEQPGNVPPLVSVPSKSEEEHLRHLDGALAGADKGVRDQEVRLNERQRGWEKEAASRPMPNPSADWGLRVPLEGGLEYLTADGKGLAIYRGNGTPTFAEAPIGKALRLDSKDNSLLDLGQVTKLERSDHFSYGAWVRPSGGGAVLSKMDDAGAYRGFDLLVSNDKVDVHFVHSWPTNALKVTTRDALPTGTWSHLFVTYDGSGKAAGVTVYVNGRTAPVQIQVDSLSATIANTQPFRVGKRSTALAWNGELADVRVYRRTLSGSEVDALVAAPAAGIARIPAEQRSKVQQEWLTQLFRTRYAQEFLQAQQAAAKLRQELTDYEKRIPTVMVMEDAPQPRPTYVLKRGRYDMTDQNQKVEPGVPACLSPLPAAAPANRLGLARWLVASDNPLTARVTVNRLWEHHFGGGLVKTAENFGLQSEPPSHPELLDWLATEFVRTGWNIKALHKLMVMSATYRQSSTVTPELVQRDSENRLLARGPRFRLPAEVVRDNALAISGLLTEKLGGPSVKPYQPAGLWEDLAGGAGEGQYVQERGPNLYRRSLYIYRKRTVPHPTMTTFDAPSREVCQVKRARTNTPLQALEILNDVTYVEAARHLAQLMLTEGGSEPASRVNYAFRRATARSPSRVEMQILQRGLERYLTNFRVDPGAARQFIHQGESAPPEQLDAIELAAYTAVASVILNLDETITRD
jgi:hypothetical protein